MTFIYYFEYDEFFKKLSSSYTKIEKSYIKVYMKNTKNGMNNSKIGNNGLECQISNQDKLETQLNVLMSI